MAALAVTFADVESAAERIHGVAHRTPVVTSRTLDDLVGAHVFLKCENLQRVGAFKFRGAYNAVSRLTPDQLGRGVVAYSSGNHAQALALACREVGARALVLVPEDTAAPKVAAIRGYGAELITYDRFTDDRAELCERIAAERGLTIIPPFEHPDVIAGQGTAMLELLHEVGPCDTVVIPVGGGGLIAGCAIAAKGVSAATRVVGVEPEAGDDTRRSLAAGHRVGTEVPDTIADGLRTQMPGELTFSINVELVDEVAVVSDDEISAAMRFAFERLKLVLEPSGAAGLAAVLAGRVGGAARVGVVLSGGNVDPLRFAALMGAVQPSR